MRLQRLAAVMALGLSLAALGAGPRPRRATELVRDAERLYSQAKYKEAAELLKKAYEIEPEPKILYNTARALDQAGDLPSALEYYRQYIASNETDPTLLKRATLSIERLRTLINKQEQQQTQADVARKKLEDETAVAQAKAADEQQRMQAERVASEQRRKVEAQRDIDNYRSSRTWAIASGATALVAAGSGVVLGLKALEAHTAFTSAGTQAEKDTLKSVTQQRSIYADASYGVGLALAVTAFFLFPKGPEPSPSEAVPAPSPKPSARFLVGPGSAGIEVTF
jgi:tetratricopeptide (TPR) repeat protein